MNAADGNTTLTDGKYQKIASMARSMCRTMPHQPEGEQQMEEFFVEMAFASVNDRPTEEADALRKAESEACVGYWDDGTLLRIWRLPGQNASYAIWRAKNATELHKILTGLPYGQEGLLEMKVTTLSEHPIETKARARAEAGVEGAKRHPWCDLSQA